MRPISIPRVAPDPDDDSVLATAARTMIVVTVETGLLDVQQYQGVKIVSVAEAARRLAE